MSIQKFLLFIFLSKIYIFANYLDVSPEINKLLTSDSFTTQSQTNIKKQLLIVSNSKTIKEYYENFNYSLIWFDKNGLKDIAKQLDKYISEDPVLSVHYKNEFPFEKIALKLEQLNNSNYISEIVAIDFILTDTYNKYIKYVSRGYMKWDEFQKMLNDVKTEKEINVQWEKYVIGNKQPIKLLKQSLDSNDLSIAISQIDTTYPKAQELQNAIKDLEKIKENGGYVKIPDFKTLRKGDSSEVVKALRERLKQTGDLTANCNDLLNCENIFDEYVEEGVKNFQKRHGLYADGVLGAGSKRVLNESVQAHIKRVRLNLERMRWLPRNLGEKYILINIPDFRLKMFEKNEEKLNMGVVVGEKKFPTPIFSNKMSYIVLNPTWRIPENIAMKELIPKLMKNPNYLEEKGINIHGSWDDKAEPISAENINWSEYAQDVETNKTPQFLRFIQTSGIENPLGKIKFMFPNKHEVYMHDSPAKELFNRSQRAFSHGCIRLSKPDKLLEILSTIDSNVNLEKANEILTKAQETKNINLQEKIPVHIIYLTSWVDEDGKLNFRDDIYGFDSIQSKLLF